MKISQLFKGSNTFLNIFELFSVIIEISYFKYSAIPL